MSDRGDFFAEASKSATPAKPVPSRAAFFSGELKDEDLDTAPPAHAPTPPGGYSQPYSYFTPEVQRQAGNTGESVGAVLEPAMQMGSGMASSAAGGIVGGLNALWNASPAARIAHYFGLPEANSADLVENIQDAGTYQPRGEQAQAVSGALASGYNPLNWPGIAGEKLGDVSADAGAPAGISTALRVAPDALTAALGVKGAGRVASKLNEPKPVAPTPQQLLDKSAAGQSMGAAGAAVDLQKLSPDLRVAVEKAVQQTGGAVNPDVLARQIQSDSLPVKVRLSEGQALGDERLISMEMNARGKHEAYSRGFAEQNKALTENLRAMREEIGPDVFSTNHVEHADTLIGRYQQIDDAANADIGSKYQALRDAAGGDFPVDAKTLLGNVDAVLKKQLLTDEAPKGVMSNLRELAGGGMTYENFESLRTKLGRIQRTAQDGNERFAAGLIREQMEQLPLAPGAAQLKPLADEARAAARSRFQRIEADPAYKAVVEGKATPDSFVQKYVIGGARDNVAQLSAVMKDDPVAAQTLKVATLDHLRKAAGIDNGYNGNFTQAGFNKALQQLDPKLGYLLDSKTAETASNLGDVARYTQFQPKGSFVNNSNTFVSAAAEKAADALQGVIDFKAGGLPVVATIRKSMNESKLNKAAEKTFAPGAGLTKLSDLTKVKEKK